jgi:outer membrane protein
MKRLFFSALFMVSASAILAAGQTAAAPKPAAAPVATAKVAVIMFQAAISQTNEFQRDVADLQKKYDPRRAELKKLNDEIENLTKQLQAPDAQLSDVERASRARTLDEKKKQLERETQDAQGDFQNDMQQTIDQVAQKVGLLMTKYAEDHGYTLVLDAGQEQAQTVLYALPSTDITKEIIDAYNQKSGIPAPAAGQPDAPQPQPAAH